MELRVQLIVCLLWPASFPLFVVAICATIYYLQFEEEKR